MLLTDELLTDCSCLLRMPSDQIPLPADIKKHFNQVSRMSNNKILINETKIVSYHWLSKFNLHE